MRRNLIRLCCLLLAMLCGASALSGAAAEKLKLNLFLTLSDDGDAASADRVNCWVNEGK